MICRGVLLAGLIALVATAGCRHGAERGDVSPAPAVDVQHELSVEDGYALARRVLASPLTPEFEDGQWRVRPVRRKFKDGQWRAHHSHSSWLLTLWGPREDLPPSGDGVYRANGSAVEIDLIRGVLDEYSARTIVEVAPSDPPVSEEQMRERAVAFAREFFDFLGPDPEHLLIDLKRPILSSGERLFVFKLEDGNDQLGSASVGVRPADGRVVGALGTWRPRLDDEITREEAMDAVLKHVARTEPFSDNEWVVVDAHRAISDDRFASYSVDIRSAGPDDQPTGGIWQFSVHAMTGEVADGWGYIEPSDVAAYIHEHADSSPDTAGTPHGTVRSAVEESQ